MPDGKIPLRLHPQNPHYFEFRGELTPLITSGEHYGAVLNLDFDYKAYLKALEEHGFNLTRVFSGVYHEDPGEFNIEHNTLAPEPGRLICPWKKVESDPARYDLETWDPAYFERLKDFMVEAEKRGVVVEYVLFCYWYQDRLWKSSPLYSDNNVNGLGDLDRSEVYTLDHPQDLMVQERFVRKVIKELNEFDNLYFEICNEPYAWHTLDPLLDWQHHMVDLIQEVEEYLPNQHLISINYENGVALVEEPHPNVGIYNFHYADPSASLANYHLNRAIGDNETGFEGQRCWPYRKEAWLFMLAGGGLFNHLDYSFTPAHPDGTAEIVGDTPGYGGPEWRKQLEVLRDFLDRLDLANMSPHPEALGWTVPSGMEYQVLCNPGEVYAIYIWGSEEGDELHFGLLEGEYAVEWIDPVDGRFLRREDVFSQGEVVDLIFPAHAEEDVALLIERK